ncbi:MAG: flippase-like domain-containing protein [Polyangiaceae bacterium]|nr:flippase-like domain-containing protein [Polyangiaceae bacterium]
MSVRHAGDRDRATRGPGRRPAGGAGRRAVDHRCRGARAGDPGRTLRVLADLGQGRARARLAQLGIRLCQHATTTSATWLAARWFGLDIPLTVMLSYMPVILVVASLPINVAGFGAVQGAWLLLSPWAPAERILAFSVVWQAVSALALIARGLPFLRGVLADIRAGRK